MKLSDAVQLKPGSKFQDISVTPFVSSFTPDPYAGNEAPPNFLTLPAAGQLTIPLFSEQGGVFFWQFIKFQAFAKKDRVQGIQAYFLTQIPATDDLMPLEAARSWLEYFRVELIVVSHEARDLFLRGHVGPADADNRMIPLEWQDFRPGLGMAKVNYLCPDQSTLTFRITNLHATEVFYIHGFALGYKLRYN